MAGFVPNSVSGLCKSEDRTEPAIGSKVNSSALTGIVLNLAYTFARVLVDKNTDQTKIHKLVGTSNI